MFRLLISNFLIIIFIHKTSFGNANQERVLNFLQSFNTLNAEFIQINNNGEVLSGKILITRPGKTRIEYNEIPLLLISDGKRFASINNMLRCPNWRFVQTFLSKTGSSPTFPSPRLFSGMCL